jgi:hypothetical protein
MIKRGPGTKLLLLLSVSILAGCPWGGRDFGLGSPGMLHAVTIVGGPVFYGFLDRTTRDAVVLTDVYYVQITPDAQSNQRVNKLVRRADADWHGPEKMSIPYDKIVLVEIVGPRSTVAKLVSEAKAKGGTESPKP